MARTSLARMLRQQPTPAEIRFWRLIYPIRQEGWHFRKQAPIGPYFVDFVCHSAKLVIEIDGDSHFLPDGQARDVVRTAFLVGEGFRVLRFTNSEVMEDEEGIYLRVSDALGECRRHPLPASPIKGDVKGR